METSKLSKVVGLGLLLGALALTAACSGKRSSSSGGLQAHDQAAAVELAPGEKIAVIRGEGGMSQLVDCVVRVMQRANSALRIVPDKQFRDSMFPWFEPGIAPDTDEELATLLRQAVVSDSIVKLGVRYVVSVSGITRTGPVTDLGAPSAAIFATSGNQLGSVQVATCSSDTMLGAAQSQGESPAVLAQVAPLPPVGGVGWDEYTSLSAQVWDLRLARSAGSIGADASGHGAVGVVVIIPFAILPDTVGTVCGDVGWRLAQFFSGGKLVNPAPQRPLTQTKSPI